MTCFDSPRTSFLSRFPALLLAFLLLLSAPASAGKRVPDVVEDAFAYALTDRSKAIQLLEDALAAGPNTKDLDAIAAAAGEQRRLAGDFDASHAWFTQVLSRTEKGSDADAARLGLTLLQSGEGMKPKTRKLLQTIPEKSALDTQNADRYYLLASAAAEAGDTEDLERLSRKALGYAKEDPAVFRRVEADLAAIAAGEPAPLPAGEADGSGPRKTGKLDRADAALEAGRKEEARKLANEIAGSSSDPQRTRAANYLIQRIDGTPVNPRKVAVLLPLEGKYGAVGNQVKEAIEYGHDSDGAPFSLVFVDSGATPETAVAALEKAVLQDGVIAALGPLLSDETDAVVEAAEALRIPLVSLSQSLEDNTDRAWVLQAMMSPGDQVRALLDQTMGVDGMDAFAVFAPKNGYGERAAELFEAEVVARGGKVTVKEFYDPAATDLIEFAKTLGRKDYDARSAEYWDLRKTAKEKGGNPQRVVLPPVVDFDAIFLPDNAARIPLACAALAYEEFPMGDFFPTKDSPYIPVLGLSGWNNHNLVGTGGPYARRSYFTDAFLKQAPIDEPPWLQSEAQAAFVEDYRNRTRRTPTPLEALMVDAGKLLAAASAAQPATRTQMRQALLDAAPNEPVAQTAGFDAETRRAKRSLLVLSLSEDAVVPRDELPDPDGETDQ